MWDILRPLLALGAFAWRWFAAFRRPEPDREVDGRPFYSELLFRTTSGGAGTLANPRGVASVIVGFRIGLEYPTASAFELHAESTGDALLEASRLERQEQTGDEAFDRQVHVYADGGDVVAFLRSGGDAREAVRAAFAKGFRSVAADGRILWAEKAASDAASTADEQMLSTLRRAFAPLEAPASRRLTWARLKTTFVDALLLAIAADGIGAAIQLYVEDWDLHVDAIQLVPPAIVILLAAAFGVVVLAVVLLRGSPGIRHVLVSRARLLALSLPFASLQLASDINTRMDSSTPVVVTRAITGSFSSGRYATRHYVTLAPPAGADPMMGSLTKIRVHGTVPARARPGRVLRLTIGKGRLSIPWYRRIDVLAAPGETPPGTRGN